MSRSFVCVFVLSGVYAAACARGTSVPDEWIDEETGHKVVRLSRRSGGSNWCFYFHQNPFTAKGDKMVFLGATDKGRCASSVDLDTLEVRQIVPDRGVGFEIVAPRRRELFYLSGNTVYATHVDTKETRAIAEVPAHYRHGRGLSVNADETLLLGCFALGEEEYYKRPREEWYAGLFEAGLPNALYTIDVETGKIHEFYHENAWLGHAQFSPTDPDQIEFCHEGPGRRLHRMWLVRTDGSDLRKLHPATVPKTFITHEFWDPDGDHVWFDLQVPRFGGKFYFISYIAGPHTYLAKTNVTSGETVRYGLKRSQYSWHYNISPNGQLLCGDGEGRYFQLAKSAKWIFLYRPGIDKVQVEKLCSLAGHSYTFAPNARFTPDGKWVVFQADIHGSPQIYAVEVEHH